MTRTNIGGATLTARMAEVLLEHAGDRRPIRASGPEMRVLQSLWICGLVSFDRGHRPKYSVATTRGLEVIAAMLARQRASA